MNILITGAAGFIGFSFSLYLSRKYKYNKLICIDNLNTFYSKKYKLKRVNILKKQKNIKFIKLDINSAKLNKIFKAQKIDLVFNFAAQAGVRYSITNPEKFIESNINGFFNILELSKKYKIKKIFYASSSSVYGDTKKFPTLEKNNTGPTNVYSLSKEINEKLSKIYFKLYGLKSIGLRFFTVYGEWGRPDMFLFKLFKSSLNNEVFDLNNNGNHFRDFTYIDDVNKILEKMMKNYKTLDNDIYNICGGNSVNIFNLVKEFSKNNKIKVRKKPKNPADLLKTHGSNKKLLKKIGNFSFKKIDKKLPIVFDWYKKNNINTIT